MRAVGLITEYNPFHNGHLHHLRESRGVSACDVAVAVMSGHFLQRGEPALLDKWVRAEMALRAGVDIVLELPFPFACNSAPHFALGAVRTLEALGGVTDLCFGSEGGDLDPLQRCAEILALRQEEFQRRTAALLRQGVNYPAARAVVFAELGGGSADPAFLATPNNILGIEYLRALRQRGSAVVPHAIARIGAGYHEEKAVETIASATGIRRMLSAGEATDPYLPPAARALLTEALESGRRLDLDVFHRLLLARILQGSDSLAGFYQIEHGVAQRLFAAAQKSSSWDALAEGVKMRQFTRTRVQRILCHLLNGSRASEMESFLAAGPLYLRLLACSGRGRAFLASTRKARTLPLLANLSRAWASLKRHYRGDGDRCALAGRMLQADLRATRLHTLTLSRWSGHRNRDFFEEVRQIF